MSPYYRFVTSFTLFVCVICNAGQANAQWYAQLADTVVGPYGNADEHNKLLPAYVDASPLLSNLWTTLLTADNRRSLFTILKNRGDNVQLSNLANAFAQLKLYPLAMKCFLKAQLHLPDTLGVLNFNSHDSLLLEERANLLNLKTKNTSHDITYQHITDVFNDGKTAAGYAVLVHIKQPVPGKHRVHVLANAGHSFITLIRYNADSSTTSLSFSFYPKKKNPFAGSPLFPSASSTFKNDGNYQWDEVAGRFVSPQTFQLILQKTKEYDGAAYHLSKRNCTDFTLDIAAIAGIRVNETVGKWPLGKGNNPGITGQSILMGNVQATGAGNNHLFIGYDDKMLPLAKHNPAD